MIKQPKEKNVRVTRAFLMGGEPVPVDTVLTLETQFANELCSSGKAEETTEKPRAPRRRRTEPAGKSAGGTAQDTQSGGVGDDELDPA